MLQIEVALKELAMQRKLEAFEASGAKRYYELKYGTSTENQEKKDKAVKNDIV